MSEPKGGKKIIIDEDWKSQVEAEKQQLEEQQGPEQPSQEQPAAAAPQTELPPASFGMLLTSLASEAMIALGQLPHPISQKTELSLDHARYLIDTLAVLQEKTRGNLDAQEQQALDTTVSQLRMVFVATSKSAGDPQPGGTAEGGE